MAVTVTQLQTALRLDGASTPEISAVLTRLIGVGTAYVEKVASGAPDDIKDESIIRMASYLYDQPPAPSGMRYSAAFRNSGAAALVAPWRSRRLGSVE